MITKRFHNLILPDNRMAYQEGCRLRQTAISFEAALVTLTCQRLLYLLTVCEISTHQYSNEVLAWIDCLCENRATLVAFFLTSYFLYFQNSWPYSNSLPSYSYTTRLWSMTESSAFPKPFFSRFNTAQMNRDIWELLRIILQHEKLKGINTRKSFFFIKIILSMASSLHSRHWNSNVIQIYQTQYH